jgi:pyrroline-5-carboxylate reductase
MKNIGIIGGGRVTRIFLQALKNDHDTLSTYKVFDISNEVTEKLKSQFHEVEINDLDTVASQDIVIIALHPPVMMETLDKIKDHLAESPVLVSFAPKITIDKIAAKLGDVNKIIRIIPNAPSIIGKGFNPICFSDAFSATDKGEFIQFFSPLGESPEVKESTLEAYAMIAAMGPTYLWFQLYKLTELSVHFGLNEKETANAITKMVNGSVALMFDSYSKEEVLDLIPVKPIGEHESEILDAYDKKLKGLYEKLTS